MAFIPPELNRQTQEHPQSGYSVLLTLKGGPPPPALAGKGKFVLGDKIFSARLSGQEIQSLLHHAQVDAIEPDTEMHIM